MTQTTTMFRVRALGVGTNGRTEKASSPLYTHPEQVLRLLECEHRLGKNLEKYMVDILEPNGTRSSPGHVFLNNAKH